MRPVGLLASYQLNRHHILIDTDTYLESTASSSQACQGQLEFARRTLTRHYTLVLPPYSCCDAADGHAKSICALGVQLTRTHFTFPRIGSCKRPVCRFSLFCRFADDPMADSHIGRSLLYSVYLLLSPITQACRFTLSQASDYFGWVGNFMIIWSIVCAYIH